MTNIRCVVARQHDERGRERGREREPVMSCNYHAAGAFDFLIIWPRTIISFEVAIIYCGSDVPQRCSRADYVRRRRARLQNGRVLLPFYRVESDGKSFAMGVVYHRRHSATCFSTETRGIIYLRVTCGIALSGAPINDLSPTT